MNLPNLLTILRLLLTPWIALRLSALDCRGAALLLIVAGCTDAADGFLARRFDQITRTGAYLDPIADKALLTTVYVSLGLIAVLPAWLVWLVVGRDLLILFMAAVALAFTRHREFPPSLWGKLSTAVQIATGLVAVAGCSTGFAVPAPMIWATAALTLWSGVHYVARAITTIIRQSSI